MGKMPLAGLIGACSLGIVLTGCNCSDKRPSYAGGRAESSMGVLSSRPKRQNSPIPSPLEDSASRPLSSSSATVSGGDFVPRSSSPSSVGMSTPSSSGSMTPMSGASSASASTSSPNTLAGSMSNGSNGSQSLSSTASKQSSSSPIQQVGHQTSGAYPSADPDGTAYLPMKGPSRDIPPPPPALNSDIPTPSGKISSTTPKSTSSADVSQRIPSTSSAPPPPPPSDISSQLSEPPPSVNLKSTSSTSSPGASTPTNSTSLMLPGYMK